MTTTSRPPKGARSVSSSRRKTPAPPSLQAGPILHGDQQTLRRWLDHYSCKLALPEQELRLLAITQDRQEFSRWTGKRLNFMVLGCYCYMPASRSIREHRHLIFIEPDLQPRSIEVTVAHELIHMADRVKGTPRRHRHHGYDSIAADEAAITGYDLETLRAWLHEESARREQIRRERRPVRYLYECPTCKKTYPRTRRYSKPVSCGSCDKTYNPQFRLLLLHQ